MADIDRIIEQLLGDRRIRESATFSSRTFSDQPLIERGSSLQERMRQREEERAERRQQEAERRQSARQTDRTPKAPVTDEEVAAARQVLTNIFGSTRLGQQRKGSPSLATAFGISTGDDLRHATDDGSFGSIPRSHKTPPLPEPIRQMRQLEGGGIPSTFAYGSYGSAQLFWRQASLMEDYEDDYAYHGYFSQYYPTYAAMTNDQLRGYFAWRTQVRAGIVQEAPLSFAFVYVYELLMGIGTTPGEQGLADLRHFGEAYRGMGALDSQHLAGYLGRWTRDYAIYHGIAHQLASSPAHELGSAVCMLLAAEHALLRAADREPRIPNRAAQGDAPSRAQLFHALGATSTYRIDGARLAKDEDELLAAVTCDVFAALVDHCAKRRKTDFVEGLFGYATRVPYTMFSAAVFYDPNPHPDCEIVVSPLETYTCTDGRWYRHRACEARERSSELGRILHQVDYELRRQLDYAYPLKARKVPKFVERMVQKAVAARLKERQEAAEAARREREEAERRRIKIDFTQLEAIRAAAAVTQEALLTEEERGEQVVEHLAPAHVAEPAQMAKAIRQGQGPVFPHAVELARPAAHAAESPAEPGLLSPLETRFLTGLLDGTPVSQLLAPTDPFPSLVADAINEKLFDLVGDTVIEFAGDEPCLVEDYVDDVRELL